MLALQLRGALGPVAPELFVTFYLVLYSIDDRFRVFVLKQAAHPIAAEKARGQYVRDMLLAHPLQPVVMYLKVNCYGYVIEQHVRLLVSGKSRAAQRLSGKLASPIFVGVFTLLLPVLND